MGRDLHRAAAQHASEEGGGEGERADRDVLGGGTQDSRVGARGGAHVQLEQLGTWLGSGLGLGPVVRVSGQDQG